MPTSRLPTPVDLGARSGPQISTTMRLGRSVGDPEHLTGADGEIYAGLATTRVS